MPSTKQLEEGSDYYHAFATYGDALAFSRQTEGAEEPLALIRQLEYMPDARQADDIGQLLIPVGMPVKLARLWRVDPQSLHPIKHRSLEVRQDLVLLRARDALVAYGRS